MSEHRSTSLQKLAELIGDIQTAMMTTVEEDGSLRSRPMATQELKDFQGELWFFTQTDSGKVKELAHDEHVNLSYADPSKQKYVSVSGTANLVLDRERARQLWNPLYKAWFPGGLDDPQLGLLRVVVTAAEYWDVPNSAMVHLLGFAKAAVTGKSYDPSDHQKINVSPR